MNTQILEQARRLDIGQQIDLVEALWDNIANCNAMPPLTLAQTQELDRRLAEHEANPLDVISWAELKSKTLANLGQ